MASKFSVRWAPREPCRLTLLAHSGRDPFSSSFLFPSLCPWAVEGQGQGKCWRHISFCWDWLLALLWELRFATCCQREQVKADTGFCQHLWQQLLKRQFVGAIPFEGRDLLGDVQKGCSIGSEYLN